MNLHDPAAWLGIIIIICIGGSYAIWWANDREQRRQEREHEFWEHLMQPNRNGDHTPHTPPDALTERPLLPSDYRDWEV